MLRPLRTPDPEIIDEWITRDPDHLARGTTHAFFIEGFSFAIDDDHGPVMYVRLDPESAEVVRLHVQFDSNQKKRNALAIVRDFPLVFELIKKSGCKRVVFESVSEPLIRFSQKRFGFVRIADTNDYVKEL